MMSTGRHIFSGREGSTLLGEVDVDTKITSRYSSLECCKSMAVIEDFVLVSPLLVYRLVGYKPDFIAVSLGTDRVHKVTFSEAVFDVPRGQDDWSFALIAILKEQWKDFARNLFSTAIMNERVGTYHELLAHRLDLRVDALSTVPVIGIEVHGNTGSFFFNWENNRCVDAVKAHPSFKSKLVRPSAGLESSFAPDPEAMMQSVLESSAHPYARVVQETHELLDLKFYEKPHVFNTGGSDPAGIQQQGQFE